jgi:hypothetical protein
MPDPCTIVERLPTVEEYGRLIAAVGFRPRRREGSRVNQGSFTSQRCHEHDDEGWHAS